MGRKKNQHLFLLGERRRMEKCPKQENQSLSNKHRAQKQIEPCAVFPDVQSAFVSVVMAPSHGHMQSYTACS